MHVANLELLCPNLDVKPHDRRYAWSDVVASLNPGSRRPQSASRYSTNCYTFPDTSGMHPDARWKALRDHYQEDATARHTCAPIAEHRLQFHHYFNELHRKLRKFPQSMKHRLQYTNLPDQSPPRPRDPVEQLAPSPPPKP